MRKIFLLLMMMCFCTGARAQNDSENDIVIQYCLVMYNVRDEAILLDMHSDKRYFIVDENGKNIVFNSSIDLLNYFGERGWEYIELFSDRKMQGTMPCYLLRKKGRKGDDWMDGIKTKSLY